MKYTIFDFDSHQECALSFWQKEEWKRILLDSHQAKEVFYFGNMHSTFFLVEIRSVGAGFFGAFILGVRSLQISDDFLQCFEELKKLLVQKCCVFVQIEPLDENLPFVPSSHKLSKVFLMPFTRVISLDDTAEEILTKMPQKGRYAVRNAQKQGVEVELVSQVTEEHLDTWMGLLHETTQRDNFSHNSREYYKYFLNNLAGKMIVGLAHYKGKVVAMSISVLNGEEAMYYYGASTSDPEGRKVAASYLLLWKTMELAREKGCKKYDLLGVADPNNPKDPLLGVSQFKQKLGGEILQLPSKYIYSLSVKFFLYRAGVFIKNLFK